MKVIRTRGRGASGAAAAIAGLEQRGGAALESVLPAVRRIVADVRRNGDPALLRYARKLDALPEDARLRVSEEEMRAAWEACGASCAAHLRLRRGASANSHGGRCRSHGPFLPVELWLANWCARLRRRVAIFPAGGIRCRPRC